MIQNATIPLVGFGASGLLAGELARLAEAHPVLELVGFLETTFAISVEDDDLVPANLDSVDRVAHFVERKLKAKESVLAG